MGLNGIVLGAAGGSLYLYMTYQIYCILENIDRDTDTALTKLFIDGKARKAFEILAISTLLISIIFTGRIISISLGVDQNPSLLIIALPVPLAGIAYFFRTIRQVTDRNEEQEEN